MREGWEIKKIFQMFEVKSSKRVHQSDWKSSGIPFYRAREVVKLAKYGSVSNELFISQELYDEYTKERGAPKAGDFIVSAVGTLGQCYLVKDSEKFYFKDASVLWFENLGNVNTKYIEYAFMSDIVIAQVMDGAIGATVGTLTISRAKDISIPTPSLHEQQSIVAILDEAFASIAKAKANAEQNLKNAKELFESYLQGVFENRDGGWEEKRLGEKDLIEIIDGDRGKNYPNQKDFTDDGFCLFMNTKNVRPTGFEFNTTMFISEAKDKEMGKGKLKRNDVVMTTRGTIGNIGVFNDNINYENIRINSGMLIFRPNQMRISSNYLFEVLKSKTIKEQMKKHVTGAAQPQLPIKTLVDFIFFVPKSLEEQNSIVQKLEVLSTQTKKLEAIYQQKIIDLEELKKSILQKAFSGELTSQLVLS